jgi:RNA polymerase sigma-70 factor (ECF subfamily)
MQQSPQTDAHILGFILKQEKRGMSMLYDKYAAAIYGMVCKSISHQETAQEVVQDVFMKAWNNAGKYDEVKGRLFTWLAQITRNTVIDKLRSPAFSRTCQLFPLETVGSSEAVRVEFQGSSNFELWELVSSLHPDYRVLIDYAYFRGYSQSEIAETLEMPIGTVKTRVRYAILELRKLLRKDILVLAA